ncbi:hypothetical protein [Desulfosporosinus sp.]|uniref:hypothetical protein n=1 Tax=Desulfosporosinus sp. TaxID=157907 RepID=UPI0025C0EB72|nr:hypothetical protein [Desulfosporosinus sp.]MBC2726982.1 hypothetical protein [Desulfosporosinus sp.]
MSDLLFFIASDDIEHQEVITTIAQQLDSAKKPLYLTATSNINQIRKENQALADYLFPYVNESADTSHRNNNNLNANLFTFSQFETFISTQVHRQEKYLSLADQKHLLAHIIKNDIFLEEHFLTRSFYELRQELFELYKFLQFYEVQDLSPEVLAQIEQNYSPVEGSIFTLYNTYNRVLKKIILGIRTDTLREQGLSQEILQLLEGIQGSADSFDTYHNKIKDHIHQAIRAADKIFIDGFLFFNDLQKFVITTAVQEQKPVCFIAKFSSSDRVSSFLYNDNYGQLAKDLGHKLQVIVSEDGEYSSRTALEHSKMKYPELDLRVPREITEKIRDGSINIYKPLFNRDDELRFIATEISMLARQKLTEGIEAVEKLIKNQVCIVLAVEKEKYEDRLSQIFQEVGVFIKKEQLDLSAMQLSNAVDDSQLPQLLFSKKDFLTAPIEYTDGTPITYEDKLILFTQVYNHIAIEKKDRPIASYPIGQFVLHLYQIINKGMSVEGFKIILYSNWHYVIKNHRDELAKWDQYISDFKSIQMYLEQKQSLEEWQQEMQRIVALKEEMRGQESLRWHPFQQIKQESLKFLIGILDILESMINTINSIEGNVAKHIETLRTKIINVETIIGLGADKWDFEQKIITRLNTAVKDIGNSSLVNMDANIFAENIRAMLTDWENQHDPEIDGLTVHVVNLENMKKYKHTFFCMLEANKYPRRYDYQFPYTKEVLEILESTQYGICKKPANIHGLEYHLKLEQYLFKNVLEFTTEVFNTTYTEKENKQDIKPSIYLEDICTMFDVDLNDEIMLDHNFSMQNSGAFEDPSFAPLSIKENNFSITELGTFLLCPKLYYQLKHNNQQEELAYSNKFQLKFYAEAVLYSGLIERFTSYSQISEKVYSVHDDECYHLLGTFASLTGDEVFRYFSFLSEYEKKDILYKVTNKAEGFLKYAISSLGKPNFIIMKSPVNEPNNRQYNFQFDNAIVIQDAASYGKKSFLYEKYLDFLTLKTIFKDNTNGRGEQRTNQQLIDELDNPTDDTDRVNLAIRLVDNINTFFTRASPPHRRGQETAHDIADRINQTDFFQETMKSSKYCTYCVISDVCKGNYYQTGEEEHGLL